MKKIYTLFFSMILLLGAANAQFQNCNASFTSANNGNTVFFAPAVVDSLVSQYWSFGDGSSSMVANPIHTYSACGTYTVFHFTNLHDSAGNLICQDSTIQAITIACNTPCGAQAFFSASTVNNQSNVFLFTNGSTASPNAQCVWNFGDGSISTPQPIGNITHTYAQSGVYNVCLVVTSGTPGTTNVCRDTFCLSVQAQVTTPACNIAAAFTSDNTVAPNVFTFINLSTGLAAGDSVVWSFDDGSYGFDFNPNHTYANAGTYTVCLSISRYITGAPPCVSDICHQVVVTSPTPCAVLPRFTLQVSPNQSNVVTVTNTTTPNLGLATWTFGDSTTATGNIITHTFTQPGTYSICMHVQLNNTCGSDTCGTVVITSTPTPCNLIAGFTSAATSAANTYAFTNTSTGFAAGDSIRWSFGDGSYSFDINPVHTYAAPGTYQVCLWLRKNPTTPGTTPCIAELCYGITVGSPCNIVPAIAYQPVAGQPNVYTFINTSIGSNANTIASWYFSDSTTASGNMVTHSFAGPGTYQACIHVAVNNTCAADTCVIITVGTPPCNLNASFVWSPANVAQSMAFANTSMGLSVGDSVSWNFGDGSSSAQISPVHTYAAAGSYDVCLRISKPAIPGFPACVSEVCHTVVIPQALLAYPNPVSNIVNVNVNLSSAQSIYACLFNSQNVFIAQQIVSGNSGTNTISFNIQNLAPGYYTIRLYYNGQFSTARFLKL